jgi:hypothetical protein
MFTGMLAFSKQEKFSSRAISGETGKRKLASVGGGDRHLVCGMR